MSYQDYINRKRALKIREAPKEVEEEEGDEPAVGSDLDYSPIEEDTPSVKPFRLERKKKRTKGEKVIKNALLVGARGMLKELAFFVHRSIDRED